MNGNPIEEDRKERKKRGTALYIREYGEGDRHAGALSSSLKSKKTSRKAKVQIYGTILRPTATYGCETRIINKMDADKL